MISQHAIDNYKRIEDNGDEDQDVFRPVMSAIVPIKAPATSRTLIAPSPLIVCLDNEMEVTITYNIWNIQNQN